MCSVILLLAIAAFGASAAQDNASPVAVVARPFLFSAPGVSSGLLVAEDVGTLPEGATELVVDHIRMLPGATMPTHEPAGPEQILIVSGEVRIEDVFGFSASFNADEGTTILTGAAYEMQSSAASESIVLRLRIADSASTAAESETVTSPERDASPPTAPVVIDTLSSIELPDDLPDPASLFIGRTTWEPGASTNALDHTGPLGIYVTAGELSMTSPSGMEGRIGPGNAVVIPITSPLDAQNAGSETATAYVFGIHETGTPIFVSQITVQTAASTPVTVPQATGTPTPLSTETQGQTTTSEVTTTPTPRVVTTGIPQPAATATASNEGANPSPTSAVVVPLPAETGDDDRSAAGGAASPSSERRFVYSDWESGWRQDDSSFYGRPWTVVYGAFSAHPRATLSFTLDGEPAGPAVLEVTGLDDEWQGRCVINVLVNGTSIYVGPSPWQSYSGNAADFSDAEWTTAALAIPAGLLNAGSNTIVIENLEAAANFGSPPYVLLSDTTLQFGAGT